MDGQYVDLEMDDDDVSEGLKAYPGIERSGPQYPPELCFCLTDKVLEKMGLDSQDAKQGGIIHIHAFARITSVNHSDYGSRIECSMIAMKIEDESLEDEEN
jgi:hypothetical protein